MTVTTAEKAMNMTVDCLLAPSLSHPRFSVLDTFQGAPADPITLHKYLYANANPVMNIDPTGQFSLGECMTTGAIIGGLVGMTYGGYIGAKKSGKILSWKTLEYAGIGLVAGAFIGAAAGAAVYGAATGLAALGQSTGTMSPIFDLIAKAHGTRLPVFGLGVVVGLVVGATDAPAAYAVVSGKMDAVSATVYAINQVAFRNWSRTPALGAYFSWIIAGKVTPFHVVRTTAFWATWFLAGFTVGFATSKAITWTTDQLTGYLDSAELAYGPGMQQEAAGAPITLPAP